MRLAIAMCLLAGLPAVAEDEKKDVPKDKDALQGTWRLASGEADGKPLSKKEFKGGLLVLKGDGYTVTLAGKDAVKGTQKVDPTKDPKTIDITDSEGPNKDKTCLGIYELKGDTFRVAFAAAGKPRPTKFSTEADSGQWVHVWKRAKK